LGAVPPLTPPAAPRRPHVHRAHGRERPDDWFWLRDRHDRDVIAYLEAENAYADAVLAPTSALAETLFEQIKAATREDDAGPPTREGGWWYYSRTREGLQYPIRCRRPDTGLSAATVAAEARAGTPSDEEVLLDDNDLAGDGYLSLGVFDVSPGGDLLAYAVDRDGSERHTLRFRRLAGGEAEDLDDVIEGVYYSSAWSAAGDELFYCRPDQAMRPFQVWRHRVGRPATEDVLVHQEDDERFFVHLGSSRDRRRILIGAESKTCSELAWLSAEGPFDRPPRVVRPRRPGVEYRAEADGDGWLLVTNEAGATNFELRRLHPDGSEEVVIAHRDDTKLEDVDAFAGFVVVTERSATDGLVRLRVLGRDGGDHLVDQPEAAYTLLPAANPEWDQDHFRFVYTSLVTPRTAVDYRPAARERVAVWTQDVPGYRPERYVTERVWATADDGTRVPVSVVAPAGHRRDGRSPGLLYGYGAYEVSIDPTFSVMRLGLLERGVVCAVAHVRGGGELGRAWYEQGRMEHKANTFGDFIAAADALVEGGWVAADRLAARGGSAGGLLMGAVINRRPERWRVVVAEVPFVDVVTTMSDPELPLTVTEWEEWGNPIEDPAAFERMLSYSPYDNVVERPVWPALYVTAGLNDPRVGFWEPAKWVARLRAVGAGTAERPIVLRTELGAGHGGPSGRYEVWRDEARIQAFVLWQLGVEPSMGVPPLPPSAPSRPEPITGGR
jgi:oligopeptidase B